MNGFLNHLAALLFVYRELLERDLELVVRLLYGSGLRLMEALPLRAKKLDCERRELTVRQLHRADLAAGWDRVLMPYALARKYPNAERKWAWQWVFPQQNWWRDRASGTRGRHHLDPRMAQKAEKRAVDESGVTKAASCHTFRHFFATHLLERGQDISTIQELIGDLDGTSP